MRLAARSRVIASALAITAIGAPAASAQFNLEPGTSGQGQSTTVSSVVLPNPDQQVSQSVMPPVLRAAQASDRAVIFTAEAQRRAAASYSSPAGARFSSADTAAYAAVHPVAVTGLVVKAPGDGFDYGDAGIGAGIAVAIVLLGTAGTFTVRRLSQPQHG